MKMVFNIRLTFLLIYGLLLSKKLEVIGTETQLNYIDLDLGDVNKTESIFHRLYPSNYISKSNITEKEFNRSKNIESTIKHGYSFDFKMDVMSRIKLVPSFIFNKIKSLILPFFFVSDKYTLNDANNLILENSNLTENIFESHNNNFTTVNSVNNNDNKIYKIKNERVYPLLRGSSINEQDLNIKFKNDNLTGINFVNDTEIRDYLMVGYNKSSLNVGKNDSIEEGITNRSLQFTSLFGFDSLDILTPNVEFFPDVGASLGFDVFDLPVNEWDTTEPNYGDEELGD
ncbi:hypothetical protein FG386_002647 [Cryptosporidium ryanae]|uniref:uncharacterized protein n=1 Tax=Cryptosporidium ryanae TaxID=515981 RepID=UPI003519DB5C|nr:hypothetical protein FG386_002647 [Cryptosporidium ryanae]